MQKINMVLLYHASFDTQGLPGPCLNSLCTRCYTWSLWDILSKANKKKESEGRVRGASGSKSAESSRSSLKKEQSITAVGKKVCFYAIIVGCIPMHASVI